MREELLAFVSKRGTLLDPEAVEFLLAQRDPILALEGYLEGLREIPFVVTLETIQQAGDIARAAAGRIQAARAPSAGADLLATRTLPPAHAPASFARLGDRAADHAPDVRILRDITGRSTCEGTLEDFTRYFRHRFETLGRMLRRRRELAGAQEIAKARKSTREIRVIGIVSEIRATKNGHRILELEDETDRVSVLLPQGSPMATEGVVVDEVVGIIGRSNDRDLVIGDQLIRPDIPNPRAFHGTKDHVRVALISDVHVGSNTFLDEKWAKFAAWIADGDDVASSVRYLVVSGDVVDGIGVYPRQDEELRIDDIYGQYEALASMVSELPDHVTVIMIPGNHDAVRPAEPQPAFPQQIRKLFDSNVIFAGNPSLLSLHGVKVLAYHGRSMDDLVSSLPGMSYHRPLDAMREMLRMRHLAPVYGGKTPIAPEAEDHLIIEDVPDIFVTGHVHSVGVGSYRGVVLVNSSTWQAQTPYQKMRNIEPMPARLPIVDLATGQATIREF
jgi:DNA polymerase II small subunit